MPGAHLPAWATHLQEGHTDSAASAFSGRKLFRWKISSLLKVSFIPGENVSVKPEHVRIVASDTSLVSCSGVNDYMGRQARGNLGPLSPCSPLLSAKHIGLHGGESQMKAGQSKEPIMSWT